MTDGSSILHAPIVRARAGAALGLAIGLGVAALAGVYIGVVSGVEHGGFPGAGLVYIAAIGVIPLVIGLPIALANAIRMSLLSRATTRPADVRDGELAMRWGKPALRLHFSDRRSVVIATGDLDRNALIDAIRAGGVPRPLPGARVVR